MARVIKKKKNVVSWRAPLESSEGRSKEDALRIRARAKETDSLALATVDFSFACRDL